MRWIKASERLPDNGLVHFRDIHGLNDVVFYKSGLGFYKPKIVGRNDRGLAITENEVLKYSLDIIEWLDESTPEGVRAEAVLEKHRAGTYPEAVAAMHEYASLVSASDKKEIARLKDERENIKVCTGCGWLSFDTITPPHIACCPDSNYIPLRQFVNLQFQKHKL